MILRIVSRILHLGDQEKRIVNQMSHFEYYHYQAEARGIKNQDDIIRKAQEDAFIFDQIVQPWLTDEKTVKIADLACGHGSFLWWLKQRGYSNARGVDTSPEQISLAQSAGLVVENADVMAWLKKQPPNEFHTLFGIDFIEHISKDDFMVFLRECQRVLSPNGILILRYPNGDSPFVGMNLFNDITHVWTYTTNCISSLAAMHRFSSVSFADQGISAIRDHRWIKVPLAKIMIAGLRFVFRTASRERVEYWNSSIWACIKK